MKSFQSIRVSQHRTPRDLYEAICKLKPEGRRVDFFFLEARPEDDAAAQLVERIVAMCKQSGLEQTRGEVVGSYVYSADRRYEAADLASADFLLLVGGRTLLHGVARDESGLLVLPATKAKALLKLAAVFPTPWIIVSDDVRRIFDAERLVGAEFRGVTIRGQSIHAAETPFWELASSLTLPKMVNAVRYEKSPFPCYGIDDWPYRRGEPHYCQDELSALGAFDIARTLEPLGHRDPRLIISQRFYQLCGKNRVPLEVWPVRIDAS